MNFRDELTNETQQLSVPHTDVADIVTTARVRTRRRRIAASTLAASVVVAGTAVGIQQLSAMRNDPSVAAPPAPTVPPTTTVPGGVPASTSVAGGIYGPDGEAIHLDGAVAAQPAAANVTWSVVDASSPEALALRFDSSQRYAFATSSIPYDGDGPMPQRLFQQNDDGSWSQIDFNQADSITPVVSGDTIYGLGTAPAVAGGTPNSFGTYDVTSGTWQLREMPAELATYSSDNVTSDLWITSTPIDGGVLAAITLPTPYLSWEKFPQINESYVAPWVDGNAIKIISDCDERALDEAFNSVEPEAQPQTEAEYVAFIRQFCQERSFDATELGLSQADLDALRQPSTTSLWKISGDSMVPFDSGIDLNAYSGGDLDGRTLQVYGDAGTASYTVAPDGSLTRVMADVPPELLEMGYRPVSTDGTRTVTGIGQYLLTATPGNPTTITDLLGAVDTTNMITPMLTIEPSGIAGPLVVAGAHLSFSEPGALTEPTTFTDSGYSLIVSDGDYQVIDNATGQELWGGYYLSTESGKVELNIFTDDMTMLGDGTVPPPATIAYPVDDSVDSEWIPSEEHVATFDVDWTLIPGLNGQGRYLVFTSADGVNFAVTDIGEVVGADRDVWINDMETTSDGRIILRAVDNDTAEELFIVGTPN